MAKRRKTTAKKLPAVQVVKKKPVTKYNPHRAFRPTRRRDYVRGLELPGYWAFTYEVVELLWSHKRIFISLTMLYALLILIFGGISDQNIYGDINQLLGTDDMSLTDSIAQAGLTALIGISGAGTSISDAQQVYLWVAIILVWLSAVWLLREIFAGRKPKVRDGLYNSGSPIIATTLLILVMLVQLVPISILVLAYNGLGQAGLINEGLGSMLFFVAAALTTALSLYWVTATFLALVIVTLPGMYPLRALKTASSIVSGRRLKIMSRIIWMALVLVVASLLVLIPMVLFSHWLQSLANWLTVLPLLPAAYAVVSAAVTVIAASYIYLLYRKVVSYDAETGR